MRTIKFRGKDIEGIWRFGSLITDDVPIIGKQSIIVENRVNYIVDPNTVGQFTGLYDSTKWESLSREEQALFLSKRNKDGKQNTSKDWNGKEIYEGDVIRFVYKNKEVLYVLKISDECLSLKWVLIRDSQKLGYDYYDTHNHAWYKNNKEKLKVIGNIHETPNF